MAAAAVAAAEEEEEDLHLKDTTAVAVAAETAIVIPNRLITRHSRGVLLIHATAGRRRRAKVTTVDPATVVVDTRLRPAAVEVARTTTTVTRRTRLLPAEEGDTTNTEAPDQEAEEAVGITPGVEAAVATTTDVPHPIRTISAPSSAHARDLLAPV